MKTFLYILFFNIFASLAGYCQTPSVRYNPNTHAVTEPSDFIAANGIGISGSLIIGSTNVRVSGSATTSDRYSLGFQELPYKLKNLYDSIYAVTSNGNSVSKVTIMAWGDSVALFKFTPIYDLLRKTLGMGGFTVGATTAIPTGGVTTNTADFTVWPNGITYTVPSGQSIAFEAPSLFGSSSEYTPATQLGIAIVTSTGVGVNSFKIQSNNNGGGWIDETSTLKTGTTTITTGGTIDNYYSSIPVGSIASVTKSLANYQVRLVVVTGTVKVIGGILINGAVAGVVEGAVIQGGINMGQMVTSSTSIVTPILSTIAPRISTLELKDTASIFQTSLASYASNFVTPFPNMDWIFIGSTPNPTPDDTTTQNALLRAFAESNNKGYWDSYMVANSYSDMSSITGWTDGSVHYLTPANRYLGGRLISDMGLSTWLDNASNAVGIRHISNAGRFVFDETGIDPLTYNSGNSEGLTIINGNLGAGYITFEDKLGNLYPYLVSESNDGNTFANSIGFDNSSGYQYRFGRNNQLFFGRGTTGFSGFLRAYNNDGSQVSFNLDTEISGSVNMLQIRTMTGTTPTNAVHIDKSSNVAIDTIGGTFQVKSGTNGKAGTFTLVSGAATVANTSVTANSVITCSVKTAGGTTGLGSPEIKINAGVGFTVAGVATDTSTYNYIIMDLF